MKKIRLVWMLSILCISCQRTDISSRVKFSFTTDNFPALTRILSQDAERDITDLNIYAYCQATGIEEYIYYQTPLSDASMQLPRGHYDFYVIANTGRELGHQSKEEIENLAYNISSEQELEKNSTLIMAAHKQVMIEGATNIPIALKRLTAKLEISCSVIPAIASELRLQRITFVNMPRSCLFFATNRQLSASEIMNYSFSEITDNRFRSSHYLLENNAGINALVTSEKMRNKNYAPTTASLIRIEALYKGNKVYYEIYLGENSTSDFNIHRNKHYIYNISIEGANPADFRVSTYGFSIDPPNNLYVENEMANTTLRFRSTNNQDNNMSLSYYVGKGRGNLHLAGVPDYVGSAVPFLPQGGENIDIMVGFIPEDRFLGKVEIIFAIHDTKGNTMVDTLRLEYRKFDKIQVSSTAFTQPYAYGYSSFNLNFSQRGYAGKFTVKLEPQTTQDKGIFYANGQLLNGVTTIPNAAGEIPMNFTAKSFSGNAVMNVTVSNALGESAKYTLSAQIDKMTIHVTSKVTYGIISLNVSGGIQQDSYVDLEYFLDKPCPYEIGVSQLCTYEMRTLRSMINTIKELGCSMMIPKKARTVSGRIVYDDSYSPIVTIYNGITTIKKDGYCISDKVSVNITDFATTPDPNIVFVRYKPDYIRKDR